MEDGNDHHEEIVTFRYQFKFDDGAKKEFSIHLNAKTLNYIPSKNNLKPPPWTDLNYFRCDNCPLDSKKVKYCPIAINVIELCEYFDPIISYDVASVVISTPERTYLKRTTIQQSLGSLLGIYMVTSGCPIMEKLKPMVRFHLPFASIEETVFRSTSVYLLGQYFSLKKGMNADFELMQLSKYYLEVQKVNQGIADRIRAVTQQDAFANAIISLDAFAKELPWSIEDQLKDIEYLFDAYFD